MIVRRIRVVGVFLGALGLAVLAGAGPAPGSESSETEERQGRGGVAPLGESSGDLADLAGRVRAVYEDLSALSMDATITEVWTGNDERALADVRVRATMTPTAFRNEFRDADGRLLGAIALDDGSIQEYTPEYRYVDSDLSDLDRFSLTVARSDGVVRILCGATIPKGECWVTVLREDGTESPRMTLRMAGACAGDPSPFDFALEERVRGAVIVYPSPRPDGTPNHHLSGPLDGCRVGTLLSTWVGPSSRKGSLFSDMIEAGAAEGEDEVGGCPCVRVVERFNVSDGESGMYEWRHELLIDDASGLVRQWTTVQRDAQGEKKRIRTFDVVSTAPVPSDFEWDLSDLLRSPLAASDRTDGAARAAARGATAR